MLLEIREPRRQSRTIYIAGKDFVPVSHGSQHYFDPYSRFGSREGRTDLVTVSLLSSLSLSLSLSPRECECGNLGNLESLWNPGRACERQKPRACPELRH
eukprot:672160_1